MDHKAKIIQLLKAEHSKAQVNVIVNWIARDESKLAALMECFFSKDLRLCQRSSWPLIYINKKHPEILKPYLTDMVANLESPLHDAVIRNTIRLFQDIEIPEEIEGELLERCFEYINNPKRPGAIRAFSIRVAEKIVVKYPELKEELILSIEDYMPHGSKAFQSMGRKTLSRLKNNGNKTKNTRPA